MLKEVYISPKVISHQPFKFETLICDCWDNGSSGKNDFSNDNNGCGPGNNGQGDDKSNSDRPSQVDPQNGNDNNNNGNNGN